MFLYALFPDCFSFVFSLFTIFVLITVLSLHSFLLLFYHPFCVSLSLVLFDCNIVSIRFQMMITGAVREGRMRVVAYGRPAVSNAYSDVGVCRSPTRRVGDVCQLVSRGIMVGTERGPRSWGCRHWVGSLSPSTIFLGVNTMRALNCLGMYIQ